MSVEGPGVELRVEADSEVGESTVVEEKTTLMSRKTIAIVIFILCASTDSKRKNIIIRFDYIIIEER